MATWTRSQVWRRKLLYPGHTLPTAIAPVAVAVGLALRDHVFHAGAAVLALACGWLIQVGGVLVDNYQNLLDEPEDREHPELVRALREGTLRLGELRLAIAVAFGLALLGGVALVALAGPFVVVIGLSSMAAAWVYSAGPLPLGKLGVADPLFFSFFGVVSVAGSYYVQAAARSGSAFAGPWVPGALSTVALAAAVPVGAITTCILIIDDIRDRAFDAVKGKRTVAVRFGAAASRREYVALMALGWLWPVVLWRWPAAGFAPTVMAPLLTLPLALQLGRDVLRLDGYEALLPLTPRTGRLLVLYCVVWSAALALS